MKKHNLVFIFFIITSINAYSQGSLTFVDTYALWNVAETYPNGNSQNPSFVETRTKVFGFDGDSLINEIIWQKYYSTFDSTFQTGLSFRSLIREENGYVFALNSNSEIDTLYNFDIQLGDSVLYNFPFGSAYLEVNNIDSLLINGDFHKRFHFEEPYFPPSELEEVWIEGIGSIHGPLFPQNPKLFSTETPDSMHLTCYKIDETILWQNDNYQKCYVSIVLGLDQQVKNLYKVYPNPAQTHITFELPLISKKSILQIKDIFGKTIEELTIAKGQTQLIWDCSQIASGIYFYHSEMGGVIYRGKLVVN
jgi:hypothetical protein